ncbi:DUF4238 domain-containing protein [Rhodococcus sp. NPDC060090]|uniref:DUF4238 domain-containing protein n=1 Tax=Rhodococcus sp. NPDC060090 TaxID=3347056 RepID=UPI0036539BF1
MILDHRWLSDDEINRSKDRARAKAAEQQPHRHHVVPQMYLKRWRPESGPERKRVLRTHVDSREAESRNPDSIEYEPDFYQMSADDIDPVATPTMWFEEHMARVENDAAWWLRKVSERRVGRLHDKKLILDLAVFIGLQSQRSRRSRQMEVNIDAAIERFGVAEVVSEPDMLQRLCLIEGVRYDSSHHDEIARRMARRLARRTRISEASNGAAARILNSSIEVWRGAVVPYLSTRRSWWLLSTEAPLATCDEPVIYLGSKRKRNDPRAYAMDNAPLILFPIDPHHVIAIADRIRCRPSGPFGLAAHDVNRINFEVAAASLEHMFERPGSGIAETIRVPQRSHFEPSTSSTFAEYVAPPPRWVTEEGPEWAFQRWVHW